MKKFKRIVIASIAWAFLATPGFAVADKNIKKSIVKIYTTRVRPVYYNPWHLNAPTSSSGSGCIIKGGRILTNAHVVGDHTFIQVSRYGEPKKYKAEVVAVSHDTDLALLTVKDRAFFKGARPLSFGRLPQVQDEVVVYGFPEGGDSLSLTRGVISRIEHQRYAHNSSYFLAIQIDAAINPGNSGGPAITRGKITGVVMQSMRRSENIGYIVPTPIIRHFLEDLEDGRYDGFPVFGVRLQTMENPTLKSVYGLKKSESGVLVIRVIPGSPAHGIVREKDVLLSIDGHMIADDATVEFRPDERTSCVYYIQVRQIGQGVDLDILRQGKRRKARIVLNKPATSLDLVPKSRYDTKPSYYIYGGLVFSPLTLDYMKEWGSDWEYDSPADFLSLFIHGYPSVQGEEVINMIKVLPHNVSNGYHDMEDIIITHVNGKKILNLKELVRIVESGRGNQYIEFRTKRGRYVILDRKKAEAALPEILKTYGVPADRSDDLKNAK